MQRNNIIITPYQNIHQSGIDEMMQKIAKEFDEEISPKPTHTTPLVPDAYWVTLITRIIHVISLVYMRGVENRRYMGIFRGFCNEADAPR